MHGVHLSVPSKSRRLKFLTIWCFDDFIYLLNSQKQGKRKLRINDTDKSVQQAPEQ